MTTGRMFEKSSQETYRYRFTLEINLIESKNQFSLHLEVGYGMPNIGENNEFYFTSHRKIDAGGELQYLASEFDVVNEIIAIKFKGERFPVEKLNLKLTSETNNPIVYEKIEVTATEALKDFESIKSKVLSITEQFPSPKNHLRGGCNIL